MPFELIHFRGSEKILKDKKMKKNLQTTLQYLDDVLYEAPNPSKLMKEALSEKGWRENGSLIILSGRGYRFKGFKNRVALEGSFAAYEFILEGLMRLQIAFDKKTIDTGILLLTSLRSEKSRFGTSREICENEVENLLHPTISMPVCVALFDLGEPQSNDKREDLTELREKHKEKESPDQEASIPEAASE